MFSQRRERKRISPRSGIWTSLFCVFAAFSYRLHFGVAANLYQPDDLLVLSVRQLMGAVIARTTDAGLSANPQLTQLSIVPIKAPFGTGKLSFDMKGLGGDCLLPYIDRRRNSHFRRRPGLGHMALSASGTMATFACISTNWKIWDLDSCTNATAKWYLAVVPPNFDEPDFGTSVPFWPGQLISSVVTDDGNGLWYATEEAVYYTTRGGHNRNPAKVISFFPNPIIRQVQIFNSTSLWVSVGDAVYDVRLKAPDPAYPRYPYLPRSEGAEMSFTRVATIPMGAVSATPLVYPRGGKRPYNFPNERSYIQGSEQVASGYAAVGHFNYAADGKMTGSNVNILEQPTTSSSSSPPNGVPSYAPYVVAPDLTLHSGDEVYYTAGQITRFGTDAPFGQYEEPGSDIVVTPSFSRGSLFATSTDVLYNYTLIDRPINGPAREMIQEIFRVDAIMARYASLLGVCLAPFDPNDTGGFATSLPSTTATVTPNASRIPEVSKPPVTTVSPTPSLVPISSAFHDYGIPSGPAYNLPGDYQRVRNGYQLLVARVGGTKSNPFAMTTPASQQKAINFSTFATNPFSIERIASRPIFVDSLILADVNQKPAAILMSTQAMPTDRVKVQSKINPEDIVEHKACTSSFSGFKMFPKLTASERFTEGADDSYLGFSSLTCYDAPVAPLNAPSLTYENIIPDTALHPLGADENLMDLWAGARSNSAPKRVIANLFSGGTVDTRTFLNTICNDGYLTGAVLAKADNGAAFFVGTTAFIDAPTVLSGPSALERCGLRYAPLGDNCLDGDLVAGPGNYRPISTIVTLQGLLFTWAGQPEQILRYYNGLPGLSQDYLGMTVFPQGHVAPQIDPVTIAKSSIGPELNVRSLASVSFDIDSTQVGRSTGVPNGFLLANSAARPSLIHLCNDKARDRIGVCGIYGPPDNKTVIDLAAGDAEFYLGGLIVKSVFVLTAELVDGAADGLEWKAGSALYRLDLDLITSRPLTWNLLKELPCCDQIWTSVIVNRMKATLPVVTMLPSPSASASRDPAPSIALPSPPPFSARSLRAITVPAAVALGNAALLRFSALRASLRNPACSINELVESPVNKTKLLLTSTSTSSGGDVSEADAQWDSQSLVVVDGLWPAATLFLRVRATLAMVVASKGGSSASPSPKPSTAVAFYKSVFEGVASSLSPMPFTCTTAKKTRLLFSAARLNSTSVVVGSDGSSSSAIGVFALDVSSKMNLNTLASWQDSEPDSISCRFTSTNVVASEGTSSESAVSQLQAQDPSLSLFNMTSSFVVASSIPASVWNALWPLPREYRIASLDEGGGAARSWLPAGCASASSSGGDAVSLCLVNQASSVGSKWLSQLLARSSYLGAMGRGSITLDGETIIIASRASGGLGPFPLLPGGNNLTIPESVVSLSSTDLPIPPLEVFFGGIKITSLVATVDGQTIAFLTPSLEKLCPSSFASAATAAAAGSTSTLVRSSPPDGDTAGKLSKTGKPCPIPRLVIRAPSPSSPSAAARARATRDAALLGMCGSTAPTKVNSRRAQMGPRPPCLPGPATTSASPLQEPRWLLVLL
jgi:hypothetical protein